jgi:hypothetical protein
MMAGAFQSFFLFLLILILPSVFPAPYSRIIA